MSRNHLKIAVGLTLCSFLILSLVWLRQDCTRRLVAKGWDSDAAWEQCGCVDGGCEPGSTP